MNTNRSGFGRVSTEPSRRPSARSIYEAALEARDLIGKVVLAGPLPGDIRRRAVKPPAEGGHVPQGHRDHLEAPLVELLHLLLLGGLNADRLGVEDEHVHREPHAAERELRLLVVGRLGALDDLPIVLLEKLHQLRGQRRALPVGQREPRPHRHEGGVDMHRRVFLENHRMDAVIREVAPEPADAGRVGDRGLLDEQVPAEPRHIGRIEAGLGLGQHPIAGLRALEFFLLAPGLEPGPVALFVGALGQARLGRRLPAEVGVLLEIPLEQRPVGEVLEPAAAVGHGGLENFVAHGEQHVPGRHAAEHGGLFPVGGLDRLAEVDRCRPVDADPPLREHGREVVQLLVGLVFHLLRQPPVGPQRHTILRPFAFDRRLRGLNHGAVGPAHDHVREGIPLVPGTYF